VTRPALAAWSAVAGAAVTLALAMLLSATPDPPPAHPPPWPIVVRTQGGQVTTVQPEDLDATPTPTR
jgi:hypothetical protein